jgi:hypothetical protein
MPIASPIAVSVLWNPRTGWFAGRCADSDFKLYSRDLVEAAHSVLLELARLLGEYRDDLVVVGGWVPQLILPAEPLKHVGSIDVELAFDHRNLQDAGYAMIQKHLLARGYKQHHRQPFIFHRTPSVHLDRNDLDRWIEANKV